VTTPLPTVKLTLDRLEGRDAPAAGVVLVGSRLDINGDDMANNIVITDDGHGGVSATITTGKSVVIGGGKGVSKVVIHAGGGDDSVDYRLTGNRLNAEELNVDLGAGNDRLRMDLFKGVTGVPLNLTLDAGAGNDSAEILFGPVNNADVKVKASLGAGSDTFTFVMFSGLTGKSHMNLDINGGGGADRVDTDLMGKIDAGSTLDVHAANTASADDRLVVRYKGELDGNLNATIDQAAASYGVQGYFSLEAGSAGKLTAAVNDGHANYRSSLVVTNHGGLKKVSILDRLGLVLTEPVGTMVTVG
jgi:hypothetical protein